RLISHCAASHASSTSTIITDFPKPLAHTCRHCWRGRALPYSKEPTTDDCDYLTMTLPSIPATRCPGIRQANSNFAHLCESPQDYSARRGGKTLRVRIVVLHI